LKTQPPVPKTLEAWRELGRDAWTLFLVWEPFRTFFAARGLELFESCDPDRTPHRLPKNKEPRKLSPWVYSVYEEPITDGLDQIVRTAGRRLLV
jgi:hypothetical protein